MQGCAPASRTRCNSRAASGSVVPNLLESSSTAPPSGVAMRTKMRSFFGLPVFRQKLVEFIVAIDDVIRHAILLERRLRRAVWRAPDS